MLRLISLVAGLVAVALAGCAKRPDAIAPLVMPTNAYAGLDCAQLAQEHLKSATSLGNAASAQSNAANGDALGVFLIGVPLGSLSGGDQEGKVALHKGEIIAIQAQQRQKGCEIGNPPPRM